MARIANLHEGPEDLLELLVISILQRTVPPEEMPALESGFH